MSTFQMGIQEEENNLEYPSSNNLSGIGIVVVPEPSKLQRTVRIRYPAPVSF